MKKKRRILIWKEPRLGDYLAFDRQINYTKLYDEIINDYDGKYTNSGNKVWVQGIISEISTYENDVIIYDNLDDWEYINTNYDLIVFSTDNLFGKRHKEYIETLANCFSNSKIPIYVIAVGAQAESYDRIEELCSLIGQEVCKFVDSIYSSGGELALRGWFTKEVIDRICRNTAIVTGCPSMYQNGKDLKIEKKSVSQKEFAPIINGETRKAFSTLKKYNKGVYIDQYEWFIESFNSDYWMNDDKAVIKGLINQFGLKRTELFLRGKIKLFYDVNEWKRFIESKEFHFSYGSRIHGNIMSILSGIPAMVYSIDTRTREMAEFYNIPFCEKESSVALYDIFEELDYSTFNDKFSKKYENYQSFLQEHNIVDEINISNQFWDKELPISDPFINSRRIDVLKCFNRQRVKEYSKAIVNKAKNMIFSANL